MSSDNNTSNEFMRMRERNQTAITEFEKTTGICVVDIKTVSDCEQFHSFRRPKAGNTRVAFIDLAA